MATVAMNSAISGLNSFQTAINYISDNVANSQTAGFKRIDANFSSFVSTSSQRFFNPGGVTARPPSRSPEPAGCPSRTARHPPADLPETMLRCILAAATSRSTRTALW